MGEPYVASSDCVSIRSLTASGMPGVGPAGRARNAFSGSGLERVVDDRDDDGSGQEQERDPEEQEAQAHVPAGELGIHYPSTTGSIAIATKRSAR